MNRSDPEKKGNHAQELRQRAEEALRGKPVDLEGLHTDDIQYLLHELQVHQAELAIQNEELRRVQQELEISRDLFFDLYNFAPSGYCTLSQKGRILNANQTLGEMLDIEPEKLLHRLLSEFVDSASQDEFYLHCQKAMNGNHRAISEIQLVKRTGERMVIHLESMVARGNPAQLVVMLSDVTDQRRLEDQQQEQVVRMFLQRRLIERSEMERMELARNLHDGPIQRLAGLGFSLQIIKEILQQNGIRADLNVQQMGEDIKDLIAELRGICNDLRPPVLAKLGLRRAIAENVDELQVKYPDIKIQLDLSEDPTPLPALISISLYRIYQQAMNNIFNHAEASEVWIHLWMDADQVLFEIRDDGQGFSAKVDWDDYVRQGHLGLVGMKERAEAVGGKMQLVSGRGIGTTVQVIVPLETNEQPQV